MRDIHAITLDLDDTLWEIGPVIRRAEAALQDWLTRNCPRITERYSGEALLELRLGVAARHPERSHDYRFLRKRVLAEAALAAGYSETLVEPAFDVFNRARNEVEFYPDAIPMLQALSSRYRLIAVTNGNACLDTIGIRAHFHDVVTAVDAGAAKPARSIFDEAVRRSGVERHSILHVGDHPENDVEGAMSAGLRAAWLNRNGVEWPAHLADPEAVLATLAELVDLLGPAAAAGMRR